MVMFDCGKPYTPWWLKYLVIFGRDPPAMMHRQWLVLVLLQAAGFLSAYCDILFVLALPQIRQDLEMDESATNILVSVLPCSGIVALGITWAADRFGRKTALLLTIFPFALFTAITALVTSWQVFAVAQIMSKGFIRAESMISHVFIVEEMPDKHRGWAVGALHTGSAFGYGAAMVFFGALDGRWRLVYAAAVLPTAGVAFARRILPESREFDKEKELDAASARKTKKKFDPICVRKSSDLSATNRSADILGKAADQPGELSIVTFGNDMDSIDAEVVRVKRVHPFLRQSSILLFTAVAIDCIAGSPNAVYSFSYLQEVHKFTPANVTLLGVFGGFMALGAFNLSGYLGDIYGRVRVLAVAQFCQIFFLLFFYHVMNLWQLSFFYIAKTAASMAITVVSLTLMAEIFPTKYRSRAQGVMFLMASICEPLGLFIHKSLPGDKWTKIPYVTMIKLLIFPLLCQLPNTAGRSLAAINDTVSLEGHPTDSESDFPTCVDADFDGRGSPVRARHKSESDISGEAAIWIGPNDGTHALGAKIGQEDSRI
eukprot:GEMP01021879.1.p1 GENE.GEMP01021879.1~~GEMP01021879.1.p1  ORF type:complete len:543 (+),score=72.03 GEMP01021879.1:229-1857(+)